MLLALAFLGKVLNRRELPRSPADAALVFGTGMEWKARARWTAARQLFERGLVRHVIVSGGVNVKGTDLTEAEWFHQNLVKEGLPADRILLENRASNTAQNAEFALPILNEHEFTSIILVMSDFEGLRAHLTAKKAWSGSGLQIYNYHAPSPGHWTGSWWWLSREGWRLTWYAVSRIYKYDLWRYLW
jgi:uncharacterized SAM-binding protein YcdF (DUF218 family)